MTWFIFNNYEKPRYDRITHLSYDDNLGNHVYLDAAKEIFNAQTINMWDVVDNIDDLQDKLRNSNVILCMANCLTKWWSADTLVKIIKDLNLNILLFSIGLENRSTHELSSDILTLLSLTKYPVYVRGHYSADLLNQHNIKNFIIGCPSICKISHISIPNYLPCKIAFQCTFSDKKENAFLKFGIDNKWNYIIQSEYYLAQLKNNINIIDILKSSKIRPELSALKNLSDVYIEKLRPLLLFPETLSEWKTQLLQHDFLITTRIHGSLFSLQNGVPALLITIDDRTREISKHFNVPSIDISDISHFHLQYFWSIFQAKCLVFNTSLDYHKKETYRILDKLINN